MSINSLLLKQMYKYVFLHKNRLLIFYYSLPWVTWLCIKIILPLVIEPYQTLRYRVLFYNVLSKIKWIIASAYLKHSETHLPITKNGVECSSIINALINILDDVKMVDV